ncbi:terminase small subunit [Enterococcus hirae]|nr:terminase small subunit [Enterococcus hirae]
MAKKTNLTAKQKRFIEEYLIDLNATQAAIRAGYSVDSATEIGAENLRKPHIHEQIEKAMAQRSARTGITQDRVLQELARIAFVNVTDLVDPKTGEVLQDASKDDLAVIQSIKVKDSWGNVNTTEREVKVADKTRSLEMLARHLGMFNDKLDVSTAAKVTFIDDIGSDPDD